MTKQQAIKTIGFILVAFLLIGLSSELLRDKSTTLSSLYSAKDNTVDVFIVGSSHVNSGYIPAVLWQDYGISAHNVYSWSQPIWTSYYYIKEAMKTQKPKAVVVDLNGLMYGNSIEQPKETDRVNYLNSFTIDPGLNFLSFIQTVKSCGIDLKNPIDFLNIVRFHTRWKYIDEKAFTYSAHKDYDYLKGYGLQAGVYPMATPNYPVYDGPPAPPYETAIKYLEKIVELSKQKSFELIFTLAPYNYQENEIAIYKWIDNFAKENNILFLNYNGADKNKTGIDWSKDFCDPSHVNFNGALKLTHDLGKELSKIEALNAEKRVDPSLDQDALKAMRTINLAKITTLNVDTSNWIYSQTKASLIMLYDGSSLSSEMLTALEKVGFKGIEKAAAAKNALLAINREGKEEFAAMSTPLSTNASLTYSDAVVSAFADGASASLKINEVELFKSDAPVTIIYYDDILNRPVYRICFNEVGSLTLEDISFILRAKEK